jgi:TRAP-type mannitol/chloroaromatic compound transport system permease small subunit
LHFLTGFIRFVDNMNDWMGKIVSFLVYPVMLVLVCEVVMRYAFNKPTIWAHETSCMLYGAHFVLGGAYALRHDAFVNVEVFYMRFSKRTQAIIDLITWTMFYAFVGVLLWKSLPWALKSLSVFEFSDSTWGPAVWPVKWTIPLAAFFMLLQGMTKTIKDAFLALTGREIVTAADTKAPAGN